MIFAKYPNKLTNAVIYNMYKYFKQIPDILNLIHIRRDASRDIWKHYYK